MSPYNIDNLNALAEGIHAANVAAGWYTNLKTGEPTPHTPAECGVKIALIHSEVSEMLEGMRKNTFDDHLPHRLMEEVEAADILIRLLDYCGWRGLDIGNAVAEKLAYNAQRLDHKIENRKAPGGKSV